MTINVNEALDWRLQYAIDYYWRQHEAMHKIKDRINYVVALLLTPIATAIYFTYTTYKGDTSNTGMFLLFFLPLFVSAAFFLVSAGSIFWSLARSYSYSYPQQPEDLSTYFHGLPLDGNELITLKEQILLNYDAIIKSTKNQNDKRNKVIVDAQRWAAYALPFLLISMSVSFFESFSQKDEPQKVYIVNPLNVIGELKNDEASRQFSSAAPQASATCNCNTTSPQTCTRPSISKNRNDTRRLSSCDKK